MKHTSLTLSAFFMATLCVSAQFPITGSGEMKGEGGSGKRGAGVGQPAPSTPSKPLTTEDFKNIPPVVQTVTPGAPPEVDKALRERADKFYQAHVDGKFRLADQYVAEDTKDYFFSKEKPQYIKVWGHNITYSDNFTKAQVMTWVDMELRAAQIGSMVVRPQVPSNWKLENGQWFWYKAQADTVATPFGVAKVSEGKGPAPTPKPVSLAEVFSSVSLDKSKILLKGYEDSTASLSVKNGMPGEVRLSIVGFVAPGLDAKLDRATLKNGESATLTFIYKPRDKSAKPSVEGYVAVDPLGHQLPVKVEFDIPDDVKAKLPKI
jgi:hypothetical protein